MILKEIFRPYGSRRTYWGHCKFVKWLYRKWGTPMPNAATMEEWKEFHRKTKRTIPYYVDNILDKIQDVLYYPVDVYRAVKSQRIYYKTYKLGYGLTPDKTPKSMFEPESTIEHYGKSIFEYTARYISYCAEFDNEVFDFERDYRTYLSGICKHYDDLQKDEHYHEFAIKYVTAYQEIIEAYTWWFETYKPHLERIHSYYENIGDNIFDIMIDKVESKIIDKEEKDMEKEYIDNMCKLIRNVWVIGQ